MRERGRSVAAAGPNAAGGIGHPEGQVRRSAGDQFEVEGPGEVGDALGHPVGDVGGVDAGGFETHGFVCSQVMGERASRRRQSGCCESPGRWVDADVARPAS